MPGFTIMNFKGVKYEFTASPWQYDAPGGWYFVTVPVTLSEEIRQTFKQEEEGWGRLKAKARIGHSEWKTAIWFDTKRKTYLLPLKASIRKKEKLESGKNYDVAVWI
jgi:hypothetical protein